MGLGDFTPKSNVERLFVAFAMLFGVAIFSYIMGNLIDVVNEFKNFNKQLDKGDELHKFFNVLNKFHNDYLIDYDLRCRIEKFFDYKWETDKNATFYAKEHKDLVI